MYLTTGRIRMGSIVFFSLVLALFIIAPLLCGRGEVNGLDGTPMVPDYFDLWGTLNPLSAVAYGAGDILCHQEAARSFVLNGNQLPVCVRDVSALAGLIVGLAAAHTVGDRLCVPRVCYPFLVLSFALMIADVVIQNVAGLNVSATRILTGGMCGIAVALTADMWLRKSVLSMGMPSSDKLYK